MLQVVSFARRSLAQSRRKGVVGIELLAVCARHGKVCKGEVGRLLVQGVFNPASLQVREEVASVYALFATEWHVPRGLRLDNCAIGLKC